MRGAVHNVCFSSLYIVMTGPNCWLSDVNICLCVPVNPSSLCSLPTVALAVVLSPNVCLEAKRSLKFWGYLVSFSAYLDSTVCACQNKLNQFCNTPRFKWTLLPPVCCLTPPVSFMRQSLIQQSLCTVLNITL